MKKSVRLAYESAFIVMQHGTIKLLVKWITQKLRTVIDTLNKFRPNLQHYSGTHLPSYSSEEQLKWDNK